MRSTTLIWAFWLASCSTTAFANLGSEDVANSGMQLYQNAGVGRFPAAHSGLSQSDANRYQPGAPDLHYPWFGPGLQYPPGQAPVGYPGLGQYPYGPAAVPYPRPAYPFGPAAVQYPGSPLYPNAMPLTEGQTQPVAFVVCPLDLIYPASPVHPLCQNQNQYPSALPTPPLPSPSYTPPASPSNLSPFGNAMPFDLPAPAPQLPLLSAQPALSPVQQLPPVIEYPIMEPLPVAQTPCNIDAFKLFGLKPPSFPVPPFLPQNPFQSQTPPLQTHFGIAPSLPQPPNFIGNSFPSPKFNELPFQPNLPLNPIPHSPLQYPLSPNSVPYNPHVFNAFPYLYNKPYPSISRPQYPQYTGYPQYLPNLYYPSGVNQLYFPSPVPIVPVMNGTKSLL